MMSHDAAYYASRRPSTDLGTVENLRRLLWDTERHTFLDRTAKEWCTIGIFYLCFFLILSSIFALQLWIMLEYIVDSDRTMIKNTILNPDANIQSRSLFPMSFTKFGDPGFGFIPNIHTSVMTPIIWISKGNERANPTRYIKAIQNFLKDYNRYAPKHDVNRLEVSSDVRKNSFIFNITTLGNCSTPPFGYTLPFRPCVFVKLNKRFGWMPNHFTRTSDLPESMPKNLQAVVKMSHEPHVWLSCKGVTNVDKELIGSIEYLPQPGYHTQYFPYRGHKNYLSPIVALIFNNLTANRLVTVECNAWAKNIDWQQSTLNFQIIISS